MPDAPQNLRDFSSLVKIIEALRGPDGCPWDKQQTHESLTRFAIEEAHELAEACDSGDTDHIKEELGDMLLQVVLHAEIARQDGTFDINDVIETLSKKMVRRHPHVFATEDVKDAGHVETNWEKIKAEEKKNKPQTEKWIDLPPGLPALLTSFKIGVKSKKRKFDWETADQVLAKIDEEYDELKQAMKSGDIHEQTHEVGDLLFTVAQLARHLEIDPEAALRQGNTRFLSRVDKMMEVCKRENLDWQNLSDDKKEEIWGTAKAELAN